MSDKHSAAPVIAIERVEPTEGVSPLVSQALAILKQSPNPETLKALLAVQKEWEENEARKAYAMALVGLKVALPTVIARDKKVEFNTTKYTHASLGGAVEAVVPHLVNHGFAHEWIPATPTPNEVSVTCRLTHQAGHFREVTIKAPPDTKGAKSGAQAVASTITLLQRYTLLSLLGIATADMKEPGDDPQDETPSEEKIDSARNLAAVGKLKKYNRTREQAEEFLKRRVEEWTEADLARLQTWAKQSAGSGE